MNASREHGIVPAPARRAVPGSARPPRRRRHIGDRHRAPGDDGPRRLDHRHRAGRRARRRLGGCDRCGASLGRPSLVPPPRAARGRGSLLEGRWIPVADCVPVDASGVPASRCSEDQRDLHPLRTRERGHVRGGARLRAGDGQADTRGRVRTALARVGGSRPHRGLRCGNATSIVWSGASPCRTMRAWLCTNGSGSRRSLTSTRSGRGSVAGSTSATGSCSCAPAQGRSSGGNAACSASSCTWPNGPDLTGPRRSATGRSARPAAKESARCRTRSRSRPATRGSCRDRASEARVRRLRDSTVDDPRTGDRPGRAAPTPPAVMHPYTRCASDPAPGQSRHQRWKRSNCASTNRRWLALSVSLGSTGCAYTSSPRSVARCL